MSSETQPVLIDGAWRPARSPHGRFHAVNPATGEDLSESYPISSFEDLEQALAAARRTAFAMEALSPDLIASFLDRFAQRILERADDIVEMAHRETALPAEPRLRMTELPRTTNQLHQAAASAQDRSWCRATIDEKLNIRSTYGPLGGPVVIFSPNNFPLAFNAAAGGDFAAAVAVGNPVIAKAHPGHPGTTKIFAEIAFACLKETGLPPATLQMVYHLAPEDGFKLVSNPAVGATAFTGSRAAGLKLKEAAERAGKPIYLEGPGFRFENTLLKTSGKNMLTHPAVFQNEAFGTVTLLVFCADENEMADIGMVLDGSLSASVYSARNGEDDALDGRLESILRAKVGRLLNDKMPTGIAVVPAMVHGGPYPATGHPGFTAVGFPASMLRFAALRCYDNVRPHRLPLELRDKNPTGTMRRFINGEWTKRDIL